MELYRLINLIFLCIVNDLFEFAGIFLNSVVIISLWKSAKLRKGTANFMILVLSSYDLLVVVLGHPTVILAAVTWSIGDNSSAHWTTIRSEGYHLAEVATIVSNYTQSFSMAALLTMTIDRYMAITRPFFHKVYVTKLRLLALAVTMDFLIIGVRMFRFFEGLKAVHYTTALLISITAFLLLAFMNYRMFRIASNVKRERTSNKDSVCTFKKELYLLAGCCLFLRQYNSCCCVCCIKGHNNWSNK